jgi:hypothetical protein
VRDETWNETIWAESRPRCPKPLAHAGPLEEQDMRYAQDVLCVETFARIDCIITVMNGTIIRESKAVNT